MDFTARIDVERSFAFLQEDNFNEEIRILRSAKRFRLSESVNTENPAVVSM